MGALRILLAVMWLILLVYTAIVIANHGWGLLAIFFSDMVKMGWPGQFNLDFMGFLILSGTWVAWRHHFSPAGLLLGLVALFGGIGFLAPYLFIVSLQAKGDAKELFLGKVRAAS